MPFCIFSPLAQLIVSFFCSFSFPLLGLFRQSSLPGDQTPFFLQLFSSRPPGYYAFLLWRLESGNLLKHVVKYFLKTHVIASPSSSQKALAPNSTYGLLFKLSFLGLLREDYAKLSLKGKLALSNLLPMHPSLMGKRYLPFKQGERKTPVAQRSRFLFLKSSPSSPFPFKGGGRFTS
ncbi:unnamed protein product [Acanthosepion pharaonis]|uniref:Uncharacterized protein n=1 Tax=Acanthosepion pharaonis TaxID=158019 RepID=A0A812CLG7_ACAPH|nr:unnamed protein product [Sepia pharaonis]